MVKIFGGEYLTGMPTMEYRININGVDIGLSKDDFKDLVKELGTTVKNDLDKAIRIKEEYDRTIDQVRAFKDDMTKIFWETDDFGGLYFKREVDEINQSELWEALDNHAGFLGFK